MVFGFICGKTMVNFMSARFTNVLKCPYYAILRLGVFYNRFIWMQGQKNAFIFSKTKYLISSHFPAILKRLVRSSSKIRIHGFVPILSGLRCCVEFNMLQPH